MKSRIILSLLAVFFVLSFFFTGASAQPGVKTMLEYTGEVTPLYGEPESDFAELLSVSSGVSLLSSGSWSDVEVGPNLYHEGIVYSVAMGPPTATVPSTAEVTTVSWTWNVYGSNSDLNVYVYHPEAGYLNITNYQSGYTTAFSSYGIDADTTFYFLFYVPGTQGQVLDSTIYGAQNYLTVSYSTD